MASCTPTIKELAEKTWDSVFRRRDVNPAIFFLCGLILLSCVGCLYAVHIYDFKDQSAKIGWQALLWTALVLDILIVGVLYYKRREHRLLTSAYDEI